jgi:hypothetical protein
MTQRSARVCGTPEVSRTHTDLFSLVLYGDQYILYSDKDNNQNTQRRFENRNRPKENGRLGKNTTAHRKQIGRNRLLQTKTEQKHIQRDAAIEIEA